MVREEQFTFPSNDGKHTCHAVKWIPDGEIRAVVQISHGMAEHIQRYREFGEYLAEHGILAAGHDHLGHGSTAKNSREYGYFAKEHGDRVLVRDLHRMYHILKKSYEGVPFILLGHSMGSFLAREYLCCFGSGLDGAILCGTGYQPDWMLRLALTVCQAEAAVKGWNYRSSLVNTLAFGSYNRRFQPVRTPSDWLCRNTDIVDAYIRDERCGFTFTLNGFYSMFLAIYKVQQKEYLEQMPRSLPVLFIAGAEDPVGSFGQGVRTAEKLFRETGMKQVECRLYPGDRHEILNELDRWQVFEDVLDWMERVTGNLRK